MSEASVIAAPSYPWRRGPEFSKSQALSVEAKVFVPSWEEPQQEVLAPPVAGNCCLISLGAYSDDSDDEAPAAVEPAPMSSRSRRPWRVSAPEFVPRGSVAMQVAAAIAADVAPEASAEAKEGAADSSKIAPWRRPSGASPQAAASSATLSTSEGSPSASGASVDSSASSTSSRSRSPTPPPAHQENPLAVHSLLRWRLAICERPETRLPFAVEPEPGTPAAAAAEAAAAAAATPPAPAVNSPVGGSSVPSWRRVQESAEATPPAEVEDSWRNVSTVKKLEVSEDSFVARQRARRNQRSGDSSSLSDEEVVRAMRNILNKLTVEKFDSLSAQLTNCGIRNTSHLQLLIQEVFDKATTQHHFIDMYADLCTLLDGHFASHPIISDPKMNFKKILLNCCQASFERHLTPPAGLSELRGEERVVAERRYKMCMLGNIRFVGALLVRKMLASKVMLAIMEELLQDPTPEALESLAALLTVVGPTFDTPDWAYRKTLNAVFVQVEKLTKKSSIESRVRCLMKDVLDIRASGWQDRRPKKIEGPLKLEEVAAKAAMENGSGWVAQKATSNWNDWEVAGGSRYGKVSTSPKANTPSSPNSDSKVNAFTALKEKQEKAATAPQEKTTRGGSAGAAMLEFLRNRDTKEQPKEQPTQPRKEVTPFDLETARKEITGTLTELRISHDVAEAAARVADIAVPVPEQPQQLDELLSNIASEGAQAARKVGFELVARLFLDGHWQQASLAKGMRSFIEETGPDLKFDVPALPRIMREEMHPALAPLVEANLMKADQHNALLTN